MQASSSSVTRARGGGGAPHRTQQQKARNSDRERQAAPAGKRRSIISGAIGRRRKRQPSLEQNRQRRRLRLAQSANHPPPSAATHRATNALPPLCVVRSARLPGAGARSTYTRCCSTRRGSAAVRATRQCCLRCFRLPSPPPSAQLTSAPPRPGPPRLTGTQAAQPPATMRTHRANARAISLRIRAAAREPALSRIHNSSSCRVPLSPREGASSPDQHHRIGSQRSNAQLITSPVAREPADPSFITTRRGRRR